MDCYIRQNRNFGIRVTSRTEGSHKQLKSYLHNSTADLYWLADRVRQLVNDQEAVYRTKGAEDPIRQQVKYRNQNWMADMRTVVSKKALKLVHDQSLLCISRILDEHRSNQGQQLIRTHRPCTHLFRKQFGLPCSHDIEHKLQANQSLTWLEVHIRWRLGRDLAASTVST